MPPRELERCRDFLAGRDEAGRIGGGIEKDHARRRRDRGGEFFRVEAPASGPVERHGNRPRARGLQRPDEIRPGGRGDQRLVAGTRDEPGCDLDRVHTPNGDEEALGGERAAPGRRAIDSAHIGGDRIAQVRNAALSGVEGLAAVERGLGRFADEGGRRQVAFADPERDQTLPPATVVEHFDDAARRRVADRRADFVSPVAFGG
jgi:hypothetical protein